MNRAAVLLMVAISAGICFAEEAPETQSPEQQLALINAKLANKDLPDEDRFRLAKQKSDLVRKMAQAAPAASPAVTSTPYSIERKLNLSARAPMSVRVFYEKCEANRARSTADINAEIGRLTTIYRATQQSATLNSRQKREQLAVIANQVTAMNRAKAMLVRNDILCPPYIVDRTQTKQSLMVGMIGKSNGLFIKRIVGPTSAIVNFCVPRKQSREADQIKLERYGAISITTRQKVVLFDTVVNEPDTQDVLLEGIDTTSLYDGAVFDMDCIVEITGLQVEGAKRSLKARVLDVSLWIEGNDAALPAITLAQSASELPHVWNQQGFYQVSAGPMIGRSMDRTFSIQFFATYTGAAGKPAQPVQTVSLLLSSDKPLTYETTPPPASVLVDGKAIFASVIESDDLHLTLAIARPMDLAGARTLDIKVENRAINVEGFQPYIQKLLNEPIFSHNLPRQ